MLQIQLFLLYISISYFTFVQGIPLLRENIPVLQNLIRTTQKKNEHYLPTSKLYQINGKNNKNKKRLFDRHRIFCCLKKYEKRYNVGSFSRKGDGQSVINNIKTQEHISKYQKLFLLLLNNYPLKTAPFTSKLIHRKDSLPAVICEHFISNYIKFCDSLPEHKTSHFSVLKSHRQRKLLQAYSTKDHNLNDKKWTEINIVQTWIGGDDQLTMNNTTYNGLTLARWKEFLTTINQTLSRDHIWAMLSLVSLVVVMMVAIKVCGMKPIDRRHEKHMDYVFRDFDHTVSIREIIALKKPFLPKRVLQYAKRWNWKRKKKPAPVRERDIVDNISDNSDEERLIYSKPINDF